MKEKPESFEQVTNIPMFTQPLSNECSRFQEQALGKVKKQTCLASTPASFFEAACFFVFFSVKKTKKNMIFFQIQRLNKLMSYPESNAPFTFGLRSS